MRYLPFILMLFVGNSCAVNYVGKSSNARLQFERGDWDQALSWYRKQNPPRRDHLLYLLDEATILHTAGRYEESIKVFSKAIALSEELSGPQVGAKTASIVANDNLIPYQGERFERVLMHVFQVLNYLGLGEGREALVEVRRIDTLFHNDIDGASKKHLKNPFATYLSGLVWQANGKRDDARIDFKRTLKMESHFPFLPSREIHPNEGELILIFEEGKAPEKASTEEIYELQVVPVPVYPKLVETVPPTTAHVGGREVTTTTLFRIDEAAKATLKDQMPGIITRAIARLAAKEGAAVAVGKEVDETLGFFVGLALLATNRADLRSWLTLPRSLQVARIILPAGSYQMKLNALKGSKTFDPVVIQPRHKTFVMHRSF